MDKFVQYLNGLHESIKFTSEASTKEVHFLDTTVRFGENYQLITTLYNKPTDTHLYLHYSSAHPQSVKEKGPYGQFLRLRRICSLDSEYIKNSNKLVEFYTKGGYPKKQLINHQERASNFSQMDLLETKNKNRQTNRSW